MLDPREQSLIERKYKCVHWCSCTTSHVQFTHTKYLSKSRSLIVHIYNITKYLQKMENA